MLSVLPGKAKEERKYPHVTADVTWMRLIISGRSRVVSVILWPILHRLTAFALTNIWTARDWLFVLYSRSAFAIHSSAQTNKGPRRQRRTRANRF